MSVSRRYFFRQFLGAVTLGGVAVFPASFLIPKAAYAQGKGSGGKGNGGGNGGKGNSGDNGNGRAGSGGGNGNSGGARSRGASPPDAGIEHDNGMRETIRKGRYEMVDAQGRTVVNRPATAMDYVRLKVAR